ncbi:dTDP-4-dehydrorhamnose reductase family protein [Candidatus Margulisiibacteriota bacterium]
MAKTKILILGATGMLGHTLFTELSKNKDLTVLATSRAAKKDLLAQYFPKELLQNILLNIDADNIKSIEQVIENNRPDIVINCIGLIKQRPKASNSELMVSLNEVFPHKLAEICKNLHCRLVHMSTDCIFSGKKGNYNEDDPSDAEDIYGQTKYRGEVKGSNCLTIRTSIIGHELKGHYGLIDWFLAQKSKIKGFSKAIYSGFPTIELAHIIENYIIPNNSLQGIYHVSSEPISKYELLSLVAKIYKKQIKIELDKEFICDRSLNSARFREATDYTPSSWKNLVKKMHQHYNKFYKNRGIS